MMRKLAKQGLVDHAPYLPISLTKRGEKLALELVRHHRILESYLQKALGVGLDRLHDEADRLEHAISEDIEERMDVFLGRPAFDPHGSPIPDIEGKVLKRALVPAGDLEPGRRAVVSQLTCRSEKELRYLEEIGLVPGAEVRIESGDAGGGFVRLKIDGRRPEAIGGTLARHILVAPKGENT